MEHKLNKYKEIISGVALLFFAIFYIFQNSKIKLLEKGIVNAQFFPKVLGIALLILSILQILSGIRETRRKSATEAKIGVKMGKFNIQSIISVVLTLIAITIYIVFMKTVGFLIMTFIYLFVQMIILTPRQKRNYLVIMILSIVFSSSIYYIFVYILHLMLPKGIL